MFLNIDDPMDTGHVIIRYPEAQDKILKFLDEFFNELI
jgi:hypothetical protein